MSEDILSTLIQQHQQLIGILTGVKSKIHNGKADSLDISVRLETFKKVLAKHLALENNNFYPELINKMKMRNMEVGDTELFIGQMKVLEREVLDFLSKYNEPKKIDAQLDKFSPEFDFIVSSLMMRITSEEDGIYLYWK